MKYLRLIIACFFVATIISLTGVFILITTGLIGNADTDFRNLPYGIAVGVNLFLALGTLPVFFNLNNKIRSSPIRSAISFFLLPGLFLLILLLAMWDQPWPGILFCVPYLSLLMVSFLRHRKTTAASSF